MFWKCLSRVNLVITTLLACLHMLTLWASNSQRTSGKQSRKLCWSLFPIGFHLWKVASRGSLSTSLSNFPAALIVSQIVSLQAPFSFHFCLIWGVSPVALRLFKSVHSTENTDKAFPGNGCPGSFSLSLLRLYLSCTLFPFWVRVTILSRFLFLFELSGLTLCTNLNSHASEI